MNRPFDDQTQPRIRLEAEAIRLIFERIDSTQWDQVSSEMALIEVEATPDPERRESARLLLPELEDLLKLDEALVERAEKLQSLGFQPADAVHLAAAERLKADVLLSCDDRFCRRAVRHRQELHVSVANPLDWLRGIANGTDS